MSAQKFYYFTDAEYTVVGPYDTASQAQTAAQDSENHTCTVTIVSQWSVSTPPTLKRKWR